jgi:glucose-6-phosphate-specific signal transduction histidine kinase
MGLSPLTLNLQYFGKHQLHKCSLSTTDDGYGMDGYGMDGYGMDGMG